MEVIYLDGQLKMDDMICSAIGFFDGLHIGHMELVKKVKEISKKHKYKSALMTFDHHPLFVLGRVKEEKYLTNINDRIELLEKEDIDYLFVIRFTLDVASLSPEQFIQNYLLNLNIKHLVCGFDFRFGKKNSGNLETLKKCPYFDLDVVDEVTYENEKISSSRIRNCLDEGHIESLYPLLNRHYTVTGKVIGGKKIGRKLGFPTANIDYQNYYLPKNGVYAVKVYYNGYIYHGMCNIGYNPTFHLIDKKSLEVYIFDFNEDIYDKELTIAFYTLTRNEKKFNSKDELIDQLTKDQCMIKEYFL